MCAEIEDEPRFCGLIACWIADGSVPSFPAFTGETEAKRQKRKRKRETEAKEAEKMREELGLGDDSKYLCKREREGEGELLKPLIYATTCM